MNKLVKTALAKKMHADYVLKLSEKTIEIVLVGAIGSPLVFELTNEAFRGYVLLLCFGIVAGYLLHSHAMKLYNEIEKDCAYP